MKLLYEITTKSHDNCEYDFRHNVSKRHFQLQKNAITFAEHDFAFKMNNKGKY